MSKKSITDQIISDYFLHKSIKKEKIPSITKISEQLHVSPASISRFAKRRGFYNFGELVASFNKTLAPNFEQFDNYGFQDFNKYKKIWIKCSKSTSILFDFVKERMGFCHIPIKNLEDLSLVKKQELIILFTISGESYRIEKTLKELYDSSKKYNVFLITTNDFLKKDFEILNIKNIVLSNCKPITQNQFDIYNSLVKIINWLNESINIYQIKENNKKNKLS